MSVTQLLPSMPRRSVRPLQAGCRTVSWLLAFLMPLAAAETQVVSGPPGDEGFGKDVTVLPNGNFVVVSDGPVSGIGRVYLYRADGTLISTLTGGSAFDRIGSDGIVVLSDGNFVVVSNDWRTGDPLRRGAVTWVSGTNGLNGAVSAQNSLTALINASNNTPPSTELSVQSLPQGRYVVSAPYWLNNAGDAVGAVIRAEAGGVTVGTPSLSNALIGTSAGDRVGQIGAAAAFVFMGGGDGAFVVASPFWSGSRGAVTWCTASLPCTGIVSQSNSLVGSKPSDNVGTFISFVGSDRVVVSSPSWDNGDTVNVGAVTWLAGPEIVGPVSPANSLVGTSTDDRVGAPDTLTTLNLPVVLANGHYVVGSPSWDAPGFGGPIADAGAVTWVNGNTGRVGPINSSNSLIGTRFNQRIGAEVQALTNGHYVVASPRYNYLRGDFSNCAECGMAFRADGTQPITGFENQIPKLVGATDGDRVGRSVTPLRNGNYVVSSPSWDLGGGALTIVDAGALTWQSGTTSNDAIVNFSNSLHGNSSGDFEANRSIIPLADGNWVACAPGLDLPGVPNAGAASWRSGSEPSSGPINASNALVGSTADDRVCSWVTALEGPSAGGYVVHSERWDRGAMIDAGALSHALPGAPLFGPISTTNSLVGSSANDQVGFGVGRAFADGWVAIGNLVWNNPSSPTGSSAGAVALARPGAPLRGTLTASNAALRAAPGSLSYGYDPTRNRIVVGDPGANRVLLFTLSDRVFANGFE